MPPVGLPLGAECKVNAWLEAKCSAGLYQYTPFFEVHEAHGFTAAVGLVLNCLFEFLTLSNLPGIKSGKIGKDIVYKAMYFIAC